MRSSKVFGVFAACVLALSSAGAQAGDGGEPSLARTFRDAFLVGAALNPWQIEGRDSRALAVVERHFNSITPDNVLKWERVEPRPDTFDFAPADRFVEFGRRHRMVVIGHTLVWHRQTPRWVFEESDGHPASRDTLLARMRRHITAVVGRYKGRIHGWDVVNEAIDEDGALRDSPWRRIVGDDYIEQAFRFAHEADPGAELYYNDFNLEKPAKRAGAVKLIQRLLADGIPVAAVGLQEHQKMTWPGASAIDSTIEAFAALGVKVNVTELDVDVLPLVPEPRSPTGAFVTVPLTDSLNPYRDGLPAQMQQALAARYREIFATYVRHRDVIDRVTFWGVTDGSSWLNNFPMRGRTNYPLLFDRAGRPKPAYDAVIGTAALMKALP